MKKVFLMDTENINSDAFKGLNRLDKNDEVILFVTTYTNNVTLDTAIALRQTYANIERVPVQTGLPNALDFQLIGYLGMKIGKCKKDADYYIVSKDKGFTSAIKFLSDHCYSGSVNLVPEISLALDNHIDIESKTDSIPALMEDLLSSYYTSKTISKAIKAYHESNEEDREFRFRLVFNNSVIYNLCKHLWENANCA